MRRGLAWPAAGVARDTPKLALEEDDLRELIDGELVEVEVPSKADEHLAAIIVYYLEAWARAGNGGMTLGSGYMIRISPQHGVMPDVQFDRGGETCRAGRSRASWKVDRTSSSRSPRRAACVTTG